MSALKKQLAISLMLLFGASAVLAQDDAIDPRTGAPASWGDPAPDNRTHTLVLVDRLELGFADDENSQTWDIQGWRGGDYNRLWFKTEGEGVQGEQPEDAEIQLLYGRLISPFWDLQVGVRQEWKPDSTTYLALGLQGVIPYELETDAAFFLSEDGDLSFRAEFEYEWLLTQRLVLQPRLELNAALSDVPDLGSGLHNTELGLRLRYEIKREFAPYLGWNWTRSYGAEADQLRSQGDEVSEHALVLGVRAWF